MTRKSLIKENELEIWKHEGIPQEARDFLDSVAWGTAGAIYEHRNTKEHIEHIKKPILLAMERNGKLVGTAVFCNASLDVGGRPVNGFYIRYFAASDEIRGQKLMKHYAQKVMEVIRHDEEGKTIFFACVEKDNHSSYRIISSSGYKSLGIMKTNGFSRFFPRRHPSVRQIRSLDDKEVIREKLRQQYKGHALVHFDYLFLNDQYYCIEHEGKIVAGCQYHRAHWVINRMPGLMGKIVVNVVPHVPLIKKIFNARKFEFLGFEAIYCEPGYEKHLLKLFESVLAIENLNSAIYWMGETCPVRERIQAENNNGILHGFVKDSDCFIMAVHQNLEPAEEESLNNLPLYASAYDYL